MLDKIQLPPLVLIKDLGIKYRSETHKSRRRYGLYRCHCGKEFETVIQRANSGGVASCGCTRYVNSKRLNTTHGRTGTRLIAIFENMLTRIRNKNCKAYKNYGGRGITVCDEWLNDRSEFVKWALSNGYKDDLTIDRINNDGNYEPSNCRWATYEVQATNNRAIRSTNTSGYRGVTYNSSKSNFRAIIRVKGKNIHLGYFKTAIDGALAYDTYIRDNNLDRTNNGLIARTL